jgi:N-acetylmuramoyl-L-alanine amidase
VVVALVAGCSPTRSLSVRRPNSTTTTTVSRAIDPSLFEPGSCESFGPTAGDRHITVFLDAGHGGPDPGGVGQSESGKPVFEADETLPVELDTMALLRAAGFGVTVSRTGASSVALLQPGDESSGVLTVQGEDRELIARVACANMAKADVLVGIYFDAGLSPLNAGCITGYDAARTFAAENLRLATLVQNDVLAAMNAQGWAIPDDGAVSDAALGGPPLSQAGAAYGHLLLLGPADPGYVSTPSEMPGALVEPLYITDPSEASLAISSLGQRVIAKGLATAIEGYFGVAGAGPRSPSSRPSSAP